MSHQPSKSNEEIVEEFYMQFCHSVPDEGIKFSHSMQGQEAIKWLRTTLHAKDAEREKAVEEERKRIKREARNASCSAYFVHQGADYITLENLEDIITTTITTKISNEDNTNGL